MKAKRIGVVMGGTSTERDVSLRSGRAVARALEQLGHDVVRLELRSGKQSLHMLAEARLDVAFLALHGRLGEDGCVQGVLELLGVPYTGSSVLGSALAMDKLKAKELFRLHNVPTPAYYLYEGDGSHSSITECHAGFGFPVIVKPRREGSSMGVHKVQSADELVNAVRVAHALDASVLVERFIAGKELSVGILNGQVLGCIEISPSQGVFDYQAKYQSPDTQYFSPPRVSDALCRGAMQLALHASRALGIVGAARVDLIASQEQNEYVLEINTLPGMTPKSLMPKIAAAAGYSFSQLCEAIVEGARLHVCQTHPAQAAAVVPINLAASERRVAANV